MFLGQLIRDKDNYLTEEIGWLNTDIAKINVQKLQTFLPTLFHNLNLHDLNTWKTFMSTPECENAFPTLIESRLSEFQKILVIQAIRPDRLYSALSKFASQMLGNFCIYNRYKSIKYKLFEKSILILGIKSINETTIDWNILCNEAEEDISRPILILIGTGAVDPTSDLAEIAMQRLGSKSRFYQIAMGSDSSIQQSAVIESVRHCAKSGDWLCLNNIHLISNFVPHILQVNKIKINLLLLLL